MTTNTDSRTRGQIVADDVSALLRARNPLLWIVTREEARVERYLVEAARTAGYVTRMWDTAQGVTEIDGKPSREGNVDCGEMLEYIRARASNSQNSATDDSKRNVWIMRDLPVWLEGLSGARTLRQLRNLTRLLPGVERANAQALVVLSPSGKVPDELAGHATVIDWPLPDRAEIASVLDAAIESLPEEMQKTAAPNGTRDAAIDAAVGLNAEEAAACYARSLVQHKRIDPKTIANEKRRVIAREKVLEWFDPLPGGLDAVGGLGSLKTWLLARTNAYSPKARAYGLPAPKGTLIFGVSGTGKSLTAKAIATAWGVPLLKLDLGALKSKFVGESEGNLRRALRVIEAIGRCVVWIDEIEKAMQGATSGSSDGGVSADALGAVLSWMQERQGEAFVVATANDITGLPPELLRKGRFDEVWWVDLPTQQERSAIVQAALRSYDWAETSEKIDHAAVATACKDFTGAEIAAIVPDAMLIAFNDGERAITTEDLIGCASGVVPLSKTAAEKIARLRQWAEGNARAATYIEQPKAVRQGRNIDL